MESKTNVVLVHGAWADGSSWSRVIPLVQKQGLNVVAAQLPLTSVDADIVVTKSLLATLKGPVVLVGHSYGGIVISGAANGVPDVKALVYIAAFGLDEGESIEGLGKQGPAPSGAAQIRPDDHGFLWINRDGFAQAFAADVDPVEAQVHGCGAKAPEHQFIHGKVWHTGMEAYPVVVHDCRRGPDDSATSRGIHGEQNVCHGVQGRLRVTPSMVSHPKEVTDFISVGRRVDRTNSAKPIAFHVRSSSAALRRNYSRRGYRL